METSLTAIIAAALAYFAVPSVGLLSVFVWCFISATLLPLGSEPAVFALVKMQPDLFWPAMLVATLGNTLGGIVDYWMGYGAHAALQKSALNQAKAQSAKPDTQSRVYRWSHRLGAKACLLSWLPGIGDPLCTVAGWLRLPFWPCVGYMFIGKGLRYVMMTSALLWVPNSVWKMLWPF